MGSDAHLIVVGGPAGLVSRARDRVDELEHRWSRFRPDSEISRLNASGGQGLAVSADTVELVRRAIDAWRLSGGAFDPTVLGAVVRAGYDRSFDQLGPSPSGFSPLGLGAADISVEGSVVRLPEGVGFDPGGIGKGLAADLVVDELLESGAAGACVNLGGDLRVAGCGPDGEGWTIAVEHPGAEEPIARLGVGEGAVATSTTLVRRWSAGGQVRHHLIDPQTGLPSDTDIAFATVVTRRAWAAEVLAKAVLLRGSEHPFDILGGTGAEGLAVDERGHVHRTAGLAAFLGEPVGAGPRS